TLPARRVRRAAPLPNSVRGSAAMRTSDTAKTPCLLRSTAVRRPDVRYGQLRSSHADHGRATSKTRCVPRGVRLLRRHRTETTRRHARFTESSRSAPRPKPEPRLRGRLAVPAEEAGDRAVAEDLVDRAGDQRGDRQDGQLVELLVLG